MPRPKKPREHDLIDSDLIESVEFELVVKEVLLSPQPEGQRSENREPTMEELSQKFKLESRQ